MPSVSVKDILLKPYITLLANTNYVIKLGHDYVTISKS